MNYFFVAVICISLSSIASAQNCDFPHSGDGGVLDENQDYILDSVLVWDDVAENCKQYATNDDGLNALASWINATNTFNEAMPKKDMDTSFKMLNQANDSFKAVAPNISLQKLADYFLKVYGEFGSLLKPDNIKAINDYMIQAYPQFKANLNC